jgi:membrane protease YdiL (CAAX protease family)
MNNNTKQLNMLQVILLHLLPGLPILFVAFALSNPYWGIGLPFMLSIYLAVAFGLIPTELFILFFIAKRRDKRIKDIISFTEKTSFFKTVLWVLPLFTFLGLVFATVPEIEKPLWTMFSWVPGWFHINIDIIKQQPSFVFNGLLGPIVEELYFRGFLLPRMSKLGKLAPLVNVVLFSLYHFFTPWENITRILAMLPYVYAVWYKRDIRIGMIVHCLGNLTGIILTAIFLLST